MTAQKYKPSSLNPVPCKKEELENHLQEFVTSFVKKERRDRSLHLLIENPGKLSKEMHKFEHYLDPRVCWKLEGAQSFPASLQKTLGEQHGIYLDAEGYQCKVTVAEAATLACEKFVDAIFSLAPGKTAVFFHHEGSVWLCKR